MPLLRFEAMLTDTVRQFQAGGVDANGQVPERHISDGNGVPCRHCLEDVAAGVPYLIFAYRPFPEPQPYAEVGPIFLHADACPRYDGGSAVPPIFLEREQILIRGYDDNNRIVYGTGQVVPTGSLADAVAVVLEWPDVSYIHVRSASNNCYQCWIERA